MNYELFGKLKLDEYRFQQQALLQSPHPSTETRTRGKPPSMQVPPKLTHHTLNTSFL
jgi:hypothetical protein